MAKYYKKRLFEPWQCDDCGWWNAKTDQECSGCLMCKDLASRDVNIARLRMAIERDCYMVDVDDVRRLA